MCLAFHLTRPIPPAIRMANSLSAEWIRASTPERSLTRPLRPSNLLAATGVLTKASHTMVPPSSPLLLAKTGAVLDETTGLLTLTPSQFANLKSLFFNVNGTSFEVTANAQAWPRSLNSLIGGSSDKVYLIVADIGFPSGQGLDFINGQTFLERFYSVYDADMQRVGLATTPFTKATSN